MILIGIALTKREEELMNFLWYYGKPATSNEMLNSCIQRSWSESYLHVMLRALQKKEMIEPCGLQQYGKQYARRFQCAMTKEEYYVRLAMENGVSRAALTKTAVAMVPEDAADEQDALIQTLEEIIRDMGEKEGE